MDHQDLPFRKARRTSRDSSPSSRRSSSSSRSASRTGDNSGKHQVCTAQGGGERALEPDIALGARRWRGHSGRHQGLAAGTAGQEPPGVNIEHVREELEKLRHSGGKSGRDPAVSAGLKGSGVGAQSPLPAYGQATAAAEARAWSPVDYPGGVGQDDEGDVNMFGSADAEGVVYMSRKRPSSSRMEGGAVPAVRVDNGSVHAYSVRSSDASSVGSGARSHSGSTVYSWRGDAASPVVEGAREFEASGGSPEAPARLADALKRPGDFAPGHIRALMEKVVDVDGDAAPAADQGAFREHDLHHHAYSGQAAAPQWDRDAWHHPQDAMAGPHTQAHAYAPAQATAAGQQRRTERGGSGWQEPTGRSGEGFGTLRFVRSQQSDADGHATSSVLQERMRRSNPGVVDAMYSRRWEWGPQWGRGTGGAGASLPQGAGPGQQSDPTAGAGAAGYRPAVDASWAPNDDGPDHGMHDGHDLEGMDDRELEMLLEGGADDLLDGDLEAFLPKHSPDADGPEGEGHR